MELDRRWPSCGELEGDEDEENSLPAGPPKSQVRYFHPLVKYVRLIRWLVACDSSEPRTPTAAGSTVPGRGGSRSYSRARSLFRHRLFSFFSGFTFSRVLLFLLPSFSCCRIPFVLIPPYYFSLTFTQNKSLHTVIEYVFVNIRSPRVNQRACTNLSTL